MGEIFDITEKIFEFTEKRLISMDYNFDLARFTSQGEASREIRNKLNFSAMCVDYGLAEIFAGVLSLCSTIQSASINLTSMGDVLLSGSKLKKIGIREDDVVTPTLAIQENVNMVELGGLFGEFSIWAAELGFGIKELVETTAESEEAAEETEEL
jgi:hypothetical protein